TALQGRRDGQPELDSAGAAVAAATAAVPGAACGLEPLDPDSGQEPGRAGRVFVTDAALPEVSERRDARMRVPPEAGKRTSLGIEQIEKDEGLETFAEVGRAHQAGDGSVTAAMRPMCDLTRPLLNRCGGSSHE